MKNRILLISSVILFLSLFVSHSLVNPNYEITSDTKYIHLKISYPLYSWQVKMDAKENKRLTLERWFEILFNKNYLRHLLVASVSVSVFYTIIYALLFKILSGSFKFLVTRKNA